MNWFDWMLVVIVLLSTLLAAGQGFFVEVFSLAGVVIGYLVAAWEYWRVAPLFEPLVKEPWVAKMAGFLAIFLGVTLLAAALGRLLRWTLKEVGLRWFDRLLGAAFGFLRGLLVTAVMALAVASFSPGSEMLARSGFAPYLLAAGRAAIWLAPAQVRQGFHSGLDRLQELRRSVK